MSKHLKRQSSNSDDIVIVFRYAQLFIDVNPEVFNSRFKKKIENIANLSVKEVYIDKSYVAFANSKYKKTFITEDGWKSLCKLLIKTNFGKTASKDENAILTKSYKAILIQYAYQFLDDLGYDISNIFIDIIEKSKFIVEIYKDKYKDNYPGKWQTWKCNH